MKSTIRTTLLTSGLLLLTASCEKQHSGCDKTERGVNVRFENATGEDIDVLNFSDHQYSQIANGTTTCYQSYDNLAFVNDRPAVNCSALIDGRELIWETGYMIACFVKYDTKKTGKYDFVVTKCSNSTGKEGISISNK